MARKKTKSQTTKAETLPDAAIEDAVVLSEDAPEADRADGSLAAEVTPGTPPAAQDDALVAEVSDASETPETDDVSSSDQPAAEPEKAAADAESTVEEPAAPPPPIAPPAPQPAASSGPGFLPLVLGGIVAGGIGWAIATFTATPPPVAEAPDMSRVDALEARLDALPAPAEPGDAAAGPDLTPLETAQADLSARVDELANRVAALEAAPAPTESASAGETAPAPAPAPVVDTAAVDAVRADLDALSQDVAALQPLPERVGAVEEAVDAISTEMASLSTETETVEDQAEQLARDAARTQLRLAIDSGLPFAEPLAVLGDAPEALAASAENGVPTVATLAEAFPAAARAALSEARSVAPEDGNPITAFLRRSTGARSLEPQEGNSADAVLSRAEAAVRQGNVDAALAEVEALPEAAKAAMADWIAQANERAAATSALQDYLSTE